MKILWLEAQPDNQDQQVLYILYQKIAGIKNLRLKPYGQYIFVRLFLL